VRGVFELARANRKTKKVQTKSVEYLIDNLDDARQAASIVVEDFAATGQSDNDFLASKIKDILYEKSGWNRGYILRNLVQLSLSAARHGRPVTIVTTNYDSFIEEEFLYRRRELIKAGLPATEAGGLSRWVLAEDGSHTLTTIIKAGTKAQTVELVYLHGRVDRTGAVEGEIVLTEASYARSRIRSAKVLEESFSGPGKGVLVVGASLTDEPLIQALALTKDTTNNRFALLTTPTRLDEPLRSLVSEDTTSKITARTVGEAWQLRGRHLGVMQLLPMSHSQSAQFLEELRVCLTAGRLAGDFAYYREPNNLLNYSKRLDLWHTRWNARIDTTDPMRPFEVLRAGVDDGIKALLKEKAESGETFRVEAWVRRNPGSSNRTLTLWATSAGPIVERALMRTEWFDRRTSNASVRTMLAGRPQLLKLSDLDYPAKSSRWQTFLAVPVFVQVETAIAGVNDSAYVPVGVITLTSDRIMDASKDPSVLGDSLDVADLKAIKAQLIAMGREIMRLDD
jgi:hypothetical protein